MNKYFHATVVALLVGLAAPSAFAAGEPQALVAKKASILGKMHKKAEKALVNAAQDKAYSNFLTANDHDRPAAKSRLDKVSLHVQSKFHVEEMCLIDVNGPELARIVGQEVANDLSPDESGAVFFKPGFDKKPRTVYTSPLYMSPDANKWVLAYVTPVLADGDKKAILHYEHGLDAYQATLNKGLSGTDEFIVAVTVDGWTVSDSRSAIAVEKKGDSEDMGDYFAKLQMGNDNLQDILGKLEAGKPVSDGNANYEGSYKQEGRWTLIAFKKI